MCSGALCRNCFFRGEHDEITTIGKKNDSNHHVISTANIDNTVKPMVDLKIVCVFVCLFIFLFPFVYLPAKDRTTERLFVRVCVA